MNTYSIPGRAWLPIAVFIFHASVAQENPMPAMDHSKMDHSKMDHSKMDSADMKREDATQKLESSSPAKVTSSAAETTSSEKQHVAPEPPEHEMGAMSTREMIAMMQMDDTRRYGTVLVDELEWRAGSGSAVWNAQGWYGGDYNKLAIKTEGDLTRDTVEDARVEALWDHTFARWWSVQLGARHDFGVGPSRTWAAFGVQGIAPYWFDVEATLYVGEAGRAAARLKAEYEVLFSQRLILQPEAELNVYSKEDRERNIGSGLSDFEFSLRLRYEFRREFAPYVGATWVKRFGNTADFASLAGEDTDDVRAVAGVRLRF